MLKLSSLPEKLCWAGYQTFFTEQNFIDQLNEVDLQELLCDLLIFLFS